MLPSEGIIYLKWAMPAIKRRTMSERLINWNIITPADVEGKGWENTVCPFDRLPAKIKDVLPKVWENSHSSTGMCFHFNSDSSYIYAKLKLGSEKLGEQNFNVCSHSGVDLYCYDAKQNRWRWAAATPHNMLKNQNSEIRLLDSLNREMRSWLMYMPLRNQLLEISIGVEDGAEFQIVPPRTEPPIVYYGTSIVHGAFTIRAGLGIAQRLARNLNMPLINLGFSGAAKMEKEMSRLLTELDAGIFVIDAYHNLSPDDVKNNAEQFIDILCSAKPDTPVVVLGAPQLLNAWLYPHIKEEQDSKTILLNTICKKMMLKYPNLHYIKGENFYGSDEVSMDGVHPNDEAFANMSEILTGEISQIIHQGRKG